MGIAAGIAAGAMVASTAGSLASNLGGGGGPSGSTTSSGTSSPWGPLQPYLEDLFGRAQGLSGIGSTAANISPISAQTQSALDRTLSLAQNPVNNGVGAANDYITQLLRGNYGANPVTNTLAQFGNGNFSASPGFSGLLKTAGGGYLPGAGGTLSASGLTSGGASTSSVGPGGGLTYSGSGNPFLDSIISQATNQVQSATNSSFGTAGRFGGGANIGTLQSNVGNTAASLLGSEYDKERQLQQQAQGLIGQAQTGSLGLLNSDTQNAAQMAPGLASAGWADALMPAQLEQSVGSFFDARNKQAADAPYQNLLKTLQDYGSLLGAAPGGGSTTSTQPYFTNPLAGLMGSAMASNAGKSVSSLFGKDGLFGGSSSSGANDAALMPWGAGNNLPAYTDQSYY